MNDKIPKVFISYSHDSPEHKRWVADLASKLVQNGIDVALDQWDLGLGDDVPKYMERSVSDADRVLMICTEPYVHKADEGKGGVGYEAMIVTGELVRDLGTSKFIPVIKQDNSEPSLPISVSTRFYVNLSDEKSFDDEFEKLLRELHEAPSVKKPPIGKNPFAQTPSGAEVPESEVQHLPGHERIQINGLSESEIYEQALAIARAGDLIEWRKLIQESRRYVNEALLKWREKYENNIPSTWDELLPIAIEGVSTYAPFIIIALAGVESGRSKFNNQLSILDDILYPRNWNRSGNIIIADFPFSMAFIYQGLHGSICMETDQLEVALRFVKTKIDFPGGGGNITFWKNHGVMGWPQAFQGRCTTAWNELYTLPDKWNWISKIFGEPEEYQAALCTYYMALNIHEYVDVLNSGNEKGLSEGKLELEIPICFLNSSDSVKRRAYRLLTNDIDQVINIWRSMGVEDKTVIEYWDKWMSLCADWMGKVYRYGFHGNITHNKLLEDIFPDRKS